MKVLVEKPPLLGWWEILNLPVYGPRFLCFAYAQMCSNLGMVTGPLVGSAIAGYISYRAAIVGTSLFVIVNIIWSFINFRKYLRKRSIME